MLCHRQPKEVPILGAKFGEGLSWIRFAFWPRLLFLKNDINATKIFPVDLQVGEPSLLQVPLGCACGILAINFREED